MPATSRPFSQYLTEAGDGTGDRDLAKNWSPGPPNEVVVSSANGFPGADTILIQGLILSFGNVAGFKYDGFGDDNSDLSVGLFIQVKDGGGVIGDMTGGVPIRTNLDIVSVAPSWEYNKDTKLFTATLPLVFTERGGIKLELDKGEYVAIVLDDNMNGVGDGFYAFAFGEAY